MPTATTVSSSLHHIHSTNGMLKSLKRKREDSELFSPSSPAPRATKRVTIVVPESPPASGLVTPVNGANKNNSFEAQVAEANVHDALKQLEAQNKEPFDMLVARLELPSSSEDSMSDDTIRYMIRALTKEMSKLDSPQCAVLINAVLKLRKWSQRGRLFTFAYVRFLSVLVSSIPRWWTEVAKKIVGEFVLKDSSAQHSVLKYIFDLIPTASNAIQQILTDNFPHQTASTGDLTRYVENLLAAVEYCPELLRGVWALIIERAVQLDVVLDEVIGNEEDDDDEDDEDEEDSDEDEEEVAKQIESAEAHHDAEEYDSDSDDSEDEEDGEEVTEFEMQADESKSLAAVRKKLDSVMNVLFKHFDERFTAETFNSQEAFPMYYTFLDLFKQFVLPTHRTRTVQFLMFKVCHVHPAPLEIFVTSMIRIAFESRETIDQRQKAMQYVSSFVARAQGLSQTQIVATVSVLVRWIQKYIDEREYEVDGEPGGMGRFRMFYSASQALFYIFCFRHKTLRAAEPTPDSEWECGLDKLFQRMIVTKFNPLKYCMSTVVAMFARISQRENAAYCFSIMEQNRVGGFSRAITGAVTTGSTTAVSRTSTLSSISSTLWAPTEEFLAIEGYFPFDPIVLDGAHKFIKDIYVEWEDVDEGSDSGSSDYEDIFDDSD